MYQFSKIKLIIWDLDDTLWQGTLSEGSIELPQKHKELIYSLTDVGIVNSLCSKNDYEPTKQKLVEHELFDFFVFPSVNWEAKGQRVAKQIKDMQLRPENVLFVDDNPSNIGEVEFFSPGIMTATPEIMDELINEVASCEKKDIERKRLAQYKLLEEKAADKGQFESNEAFLMSSNVKVNICDNCLDEIDRIHELLLRSNQLNFTKDRITKEELVELVSKENIKSAYVTVSDKFGDYGLVGFFALDNGRLVHFLFSCRTLGMGIEQYVYNVLERPELIVVGDVVSDLSSTEIPVWINNNTSSDKEDRMTLSNVDKHQVLIKGPCDLFQIFPYIANTELFDTEFTYVSDKGILVESTGHTTNIAEAIKLSKEQKEKIVNEVPFLDIGMYGDKIVKHPYKVVFISILADANLGVYRRRETGEKFACIEYLHPLCDKENWNGIISGDYHNNGFPFTEDLLRDFSEKYEFLGRNTSEQILENLKFIRENLRDDCLLVIMLGGETYYEKNTFPAYMDRHIVHKDINSRIRSWAADVSNVKLMDVNKYITGQESFYDHFNHYVKPIYYKLAEEMVEIVNSHCEKSIRKTSKFKMVYIRCKEILAPMYRKIKRLIGRK